MTDISGPVYRIPDGLRVYAIGDIHGHANALDRMHEAISKDLLSGDHPDKAHIIYLGDYIDRGPDSRGVVERLMERKDRGDGIIKSFLMGNHEMAVFEFMEDPIGSDWLRYGGLETLRSYGLEFEGDIVLPGEAERAARAMRELIPNEHFEFLQHLQFAVEIGDYLFVHAGIDPFKSLAEQTVHDLTRIRDPFLNWHKHRDFKPFSHKVVHGHSIAREPCVRPHRICVDTGLYEDGGKLTAVVLEGADVRFLQV